jgi:putative phosphoesterase
MSPRGWHFMRIAIISDIHANLAALRALPQKYDQLWCIGDLVDYGPRPVEVVRELRRRSTVVVSGNHDYAAGYDADPRCSVPFRSLADETLRYTRRLCSEQDLNFLRGLPRHHEVTVGSTRFFLVHATPTDPLFAYCPEGSDRWVREVAAIRADVLVVGHTHTPFWRKVGDTIIMNPGSLGQPKTGRSHACYAVWEDGKISLEEYEYPAEETIRGIRAMPLSEEDQSALISVLTTGVLPSTYASADSCGQGSRR